VEFSGNAVTDFFFAEVGITQLQFNIGNQLMYLGIALFEVNHSPASPERL
jgi:hypothetical protein